MADLPSQLYFVIMLISPYKVQPDVWGRRFFTSAHPAKSFISKRIQTLITHRKTSDTAYQFETVLLSECGEDLTRYDFVAPRDYRVIEQCVIERLDRSNRATRMPVHAVYEVLFDRWTRSYTPSVTVLACYDSKEAAEEVAIALTEKYPQDPEHRCSDHGGLVKDFSEEVFTDDIDLGGFDDGGVESMIAEWHEKDERKKAHIWFLVRRAKGASTENASRNATQGPFLARTGAVGVRGASLGDLPDDLNGPLMDLDSLECTGAADGTAAESPNANYQRGRAGRVYDRAAHAPHRSLPAALVTG